MDCTQHSGLSTQDLVGGLDMQIYCNRYYCHKAVEVCYWACKFRRNCKDWQDALKETPGIDAIRERLEASSKKTGRAFDPKALVVLTGVKRKAKSRV
jgi:hypothetical protein